MGIPVYSGKIFIDIQPLTVENVQCNYITQLTRVTCYFINFLCWTRVVDKIIFCSNNRKELSPKCVEWDIKCTRSVVAE